MAIKQSKKQKPVTKYKISFISHVETTSEIENKLNELAKLGEIVSVSFDSENRVLITYKVTE